jgi:hypothetical protein
MRSTARGQTSCPTSGKKGKLESCVNAGWIAFKAMFGPQSEAGAVDGPVLMDRWCEA